MKHVLLHLFYVFICCSVLSGCQKQLLSAGGPSYSAVSQAAPRTLPIRTYAAVRALKKDKKEEAKKEEKKERRVIDDKDRPKPFGKTAWVPVDDVYVKRFYARVIHSATDSIDMLKRFQKLDFTPADQPVYIDLKLDMKLEKKKKVDPFVSTVHLPHPFRTEMNKVLVFTEDSGQAAFAKENGAAFVGGAELIQPILDDEISADFYVAVPDMLTKIVPLKNKLRKKFPKSKRGTVTNNISQAMQLFKTGHEYQVESECFVRTQIATLDMPSEQIFANLQAILTDVCLRRPASLGPFVERAIMSSQTSEAIWFRTESVLPEVAQTDQK
uniref:Large ribosomal subunit protein uL1m n=1 Tax=Poecilia reticulata TaxID=8081 RepID=A0A3P9N648_POERE